MPRSQTYPLAVAGLAVVAAWLCSGLTADVDRRLQATYARTLVGPSATQAVLLVGIDAATQAAWGGAGTPAQLEQLAAALATGEPRLVIWPEGQVDGAAVGGPSAPPGGDPGYVMCEPGAADGDAREAEAARGPCLGVDPLVGPRLMRAQSPEFPAVALRSLGLPQPTTSLPARYVTGLPSVPAHRVEAGEIPSRTFRDRIVLVGRNDPMSATISTPLGLMSPVEVEAHALLGVVDGAVWRPVPLWTRAAALSLWALGLALALRRRSPAALVLGTLVACAVALAIDAMFFELGLVRLGSAAALIVAGTIGAALLLGRSLRGVPRGLLGRTDEAFASTASGMRKVSDA